MNYIRAYEKFEGYTKEVLRKVSKVDQQFLCKFIVTTLLEISPHILIFIHFCIVTKDYYITGRANMISCAVGLR